jgi:hypothetical protein
MKKLSEDLLYGGPANASQAAEVQGEAGTDTPIDKQGEDGAMRDVCGSDLDRYEPDGDLPEMSGCYEKPVDAIAESELSKKWNDAFARFKDSGEREQHATGAVRDTRTGKGRFDLIPYEGLEALAKVFETGSLKYGDRNWEQGMPVSRFIDSMCRHAMKAASGQTDEPHLAMCMWNACCAITMMVRHPELNDHPWRNA